jgi:hypothetical protein
LERPDFPEWDYTILAWVRSTYQGRPPIYSAATVARDPLPPMNSTPAIF